MDGYQKTENLKLNKITRDMIVDIEPIDENFKKIDKDAEKYLKDLIKELKKEKESTYFNEENTKVKTKKI